MSPELLKQRAPKLLDVLIIGGGLSGLMVAHELQQSTPPLSWRLLEARPILGGRLVNDDKGQAIDLGGAWIWPSQQPHMKRLTASLSIPTFIQPDDGMSTRIVGGAVQYIHRLEETLPPDAIQVNSAVTSVSLKSSMEDSSCSADQGPVVQVETTSQETFLARRVVFAVPPKLVSKHVTFDPPLSQRKQSAMSASHTWMAGVTKVGLVYPGRFWDLHASNMGFPPGGPAFQVYDASTNDKSVSALTFFTLATDTDDDQLLAAKCAAQIQKIWSYYGKSYADTAKDYVDYHVQRWPKETYISEDPAPSRIHPHPDPVRDLSTNEWDGALLFAGSETDRSSPGVMEGAVGAALRVVKDIQAYFSSKSSTKRES